MQGVPFFFKQWGGVRKAKNGRLLDGRTYDEYPQRMVATVPDRADCLKYAAEFEQGLRSVTQESLVQLMGRLRPLPLDTRSYTGN